jgi:hypothetical protein
MARTTEGINTFDLTSLRRKIIQRMGRNTSMHCTRQRICGFHKMDSNTARAADGVMTS